MTFIHYADAPVVKVSNTIERRLIHTDHLLTAIVDFSNGPASKPDPFHSHPHEQTSYVAAGEILLFVEEDAPVHLQAGDLFAVSSGQKHAVQLLTPTARLIDNFHPVREDFLY